MSYAGSIVEIPVGLEGLSGNKNFAKVSAGSLLEANNISFEKGTLSREGGSTKYNPVAISGAPSIIGGWDWWPSSGVQRSIVFTSTGSLVRDNGALTYSTLLASGLAIGLATPVFVEGGNEIAANNRKLFIFTGAAPVQVLSGDGVTTSAISAPPADWAGTAQPVGGAIHEGCLWGWGNANDPHRVYKSLPTNHEDFTTTPFSMTVYPGEGERIVAGTSFKGLLVLWKYPTGIYAIDTSSATSSDWRPIRITQAVGMASPRAFAQVDTGVDEDILYMDKNGHFQFLSATDEFGFVHMRNLPSFDEFNEFMRTRVNFARLFYTQAVYYSAKREAHFTVASIGALANTRRIVIDFNGPSPRFRFSDKDTCQSIWLRIDTSGTSRLMSGDASGFVWHLDQANINKDGAAYLSRAQTMHTDLSYADPVFATKRKLAEFLELIVEHRSDSTLFVDILWDGNVKETIPFVMGGSLATWGGSTNWGAFQWGGSRIVSRRKRITGSGIRLSLIFRNNQANEDFSIIKALLYFRQGDERAV